MKIRELEAALNKSENDKESLRINIQAVITEANKRLVAMGATFMLEFDDSEYIGS